MWFRFEQVLCVVKALSVLTMKFLVGLLKNNCRIFYLDNVNKQHRMDDKNTCRKYMDLQDCKSKWDLIFQSG